MAHAPSVASSHRNSAHGLTTFPNPFQDEPEQGILPSFLSKVKQTFTSGSSTAAIISQQAKPDKGGSDSNVGNYAYEEDYSKIQPPREGGQTEAQAIAEAVMRNRAQMATAAAHAASVQQGRVSTAAVPIIVQPGADPPVSAPMQPAHSTSPLATLSMKPPLSTVNSAGSTSTQPPAAPPSVAPSHNSTVPTKRTLAPGERQWRPSGIAPAQVTISPVTTTVQTASKEPPPSPGPRSVPFPISKPSHRTHIHISNPAGPSSSRSATPLHHHAHSNSLGMTTGKRARRSSIATLPDSPSSLSISGMIAANAELQSHYVPGFPISQDDTRSVRSIGAVKRLNGMSRIIRRMKGEGLSKQYWMADEHCKECYDCKSLFTAWRRKHHCRICGQIFCSRCASNIINARRFGKDGVLRVCNLCLKIMEEYKEDDEDDRRSINSVSTSVHRYPSITDRAFLDAAISPELQYAKSPFAASQLFASHPNDSLTAIDESSVSGPFSRWGNELSHEEDIEFQRPFSPNDGSDGEGGQMWIGKAPKTAAPFRRPMEMDQKIQPESESPDPENETPGTPSTAPPSGPILGGAHRNVSLPRLEFPRTYTMSTDGDEGRSPLERSESNHQLIGLRTRASQAGLTALLDGERTEGLWRARSHSFAKQPEMLSGASLHHFQLMLAQSISRADLPRPEEWHRVLSSLILKVPNNLQPNVRAGDDIDVRSYIKIKKVPGGKISDSEYVDGIVITKNVAHKTMSRRLYNPRIMVVTFPLDYHRVDNQFMSLDPILAQEKDYLRLLTKRIIDAKPHIVLAQSSVSRIALDYLLESDIALARNVKSSAVHQVARCTGADIVASMDRLVLQPRMGRCGELQIQSFDHELIPGRRKTLMRFEGANREQGCTIILRGADLETLRKVKVITDFMSLVAYHLKMEMILYNDEHNIVPPEPPLPAEYRELLNMLEPRPSAASSRAESVTSETSSIRDPPATPTPHSVNVDTPDPESPTTPKPNSTFTTNTAASSIHDSDDDERENEKREALEVTSQIATSLQPYLNTVLSSSAAIRFPPPAILAKMAELDRRLAELRQSRDEAEAAQILEEETKIIEPPKTSLHPVAVHDGGDTASIHTIASTATGNSAATATEPSAELSSSAAMSALPTSTFSTVTHKGKDIDRDPYRVLRKPDEVSKESALAQVQHAHKEHLKLWQWHIRRFAPEQLRPENYQGIVFLSSLGCEGTDKPCVEPALKHIDFYQAGDQTVGQFMETLTATALEPCPSKTCERLLLFHFHLLVHGERRLQIVLDQFPCPSPGHEEQIITWSYCRQCTTPSPTTILREETWKMSWGAYLEHCFYPPETPAGFSCPHDAYRDQIRYFAHRNLAVRIHNEQIDIFEPVRPSISLQVKAETKVALKNREYEVALAKNGAFFDSVVTRLKTIDVNVVQSDKVSLLEKTIDHMLARVASDKEEMVDLLNRTYKLTPMTDVLSLTTVFRSLHDKVVQWDMDFGDIEKAFIPTEKDLKKMTATHLKRLFANQDAYSTLERGAGPPLAEADEENAGEKEVNLESSDYTPGPTQPTTPAPGTPDANAAARASEEPTAIDLSSETDASATPIAEVNKVISDPMAVPAPNGASSQRPDTETVDGEKEKGFETDSTVSALPSDFAGKSPDGAAESSALDSDAIHFVSRLPRRSAPAPSIADLVQRFNDSTKLAPPEPVFTPKLERPRSGGGSRRQSPRPHLVDVSDSDHSPRTRPKLRRGRTEQPVARAREALRPGLLSDGDRSYAANASRIPSSYRHKSIGEGMSSDYLSVTRPGMGSRNSSYTGRSPSQVDHRSSPQLRHPTPGHAPLSPYPSSEGKPRVGGKGKTPRPPDSDRHSPSVGRTRRGGQPGSSRVTSMARHFDRLSREAERERQKRISIVRGKRARPVSVTKAKVQVFDNLRDAFRDEFDSDSSEADNEEDDLGSDDSIGSAGRPDKERRKSSPVKSRKSSSPKKDLPSPLPHPPSTSETLPAPVSKAVDLVESAPVEGSSKQEQAAAISSSIRTLSVLSDTKSEISFTDRLKIELPSFETSAPLPSHPATPHVSTDATTADEAIGTFSTSQASDVEIGTANEKSSLLKSLSGLWAFRAADLTPLEYPLSASEHIFADSRVIIRETEPTSIIAFTLSSKTYRDNSKSWSSNKTEGHFESFMPEEAAGTDRAAAWDVVSLDEVDDSTRPERGTHLKYDFESGTSTIFCRIFFAEQFAALRKACNCEDSFVESLARCVQFDASGGKSGSAFLKTKDDRFIAKEITRLEMDALTKFAPAYFDYTRKAFQGQRPTVLAKIYGFFKIGFNNAVTGRTMKMNVLIMENLFYERRFTKIYDLKGSTRNRLIQPTGRVNEVLLDENLMEIVYKHPLYLREQAKRILRTALFNDTLFLSNLNVMDYSLVVGVDAEKHELVVGIVDYIRTFTWDKKLESWVKDLGAGGKGEPTIVTPKQYKLRFRTAMERFYFPWVPDRWTVIGSEDEVPLEEENAAAGAALAVAS